MGIYKQVFFLGMVFFVLFSTKVFAEETLGIKKYKLTEQQCIDIVKQHPAWNRIWQSQVDRGKADIRIAGRWPNPGIGYEREKVGSNEETTVSVSQTFDLSGRRGQRRKSAKHMLTAIESSVTQQRRKRKTDARLLFNQTLYHQKRVDLHRAWLARLKPSRFSGNDFRWVSREAGLAKARMRSEYAMYQRQWQRLRVALGEARHQYDGVSGVVYAASTLPSIESLFTRLNQRPDLLAMASRVKAHAFALRATKRSWLPDMTVGVGRKTVEENGTKDDGNIVSLSFSWPNSDRGKGHRLRAQSTMTLEQDRYQLYISKARGDVRGLWQQAQELRSAYLEYQRLQRLHTPQRLIRSTEIAYRMGRLQINQVLEAYRNVLQSQLQLIDMGFAARKTEIELAHISAEGA